MLPAELNIGALPPTLAFVVILLGLGLRFYKVRTATRGESRKDEWARMRDLLDELRSQRDAKDRQLNQKDDLIEQQAEYITQLRKDLRRALKNVDHHREEPS